ncbi:phosphotransferase [Kitasatospora sp. RG8]|uniref:phosphotransferase n=1 Tax=Kitasatospora sp. RG8 TaxID=2820815 RepID=UPI0027DCF7BA|nr:phosphotransferase [Kitasatospora sp. RG8]
MSDPAAQPDLTAVLAEAYGLPGAVLERLPVGQVTVNYRARVGDRLLFVKHYRDGVTDLGAERAAVEQTRLARLRRVPVAAVRPAAGGATVVRHGSTTVSVWEWMPGAIVDSGLNPAQQRAAGAALGRIHSAFADHPAGRRPTAAVDDWLHPDLGLLEATVDKLLGIAGGRPRRGEFDEQALRTLTERREVLRGIPELLAGLPPLTTQVLHGDYSAVNLLFQGDELTAVLDFLPPESFLAAYELGRIAFDPRTVVLDEDWITSGVNLVGSYLETNPLLPAADVTACARVALIQLLTSLYGVKQHYLKPGLLQPDLDRFWLLRHAAAQRLLDHLGDVESALAQAAHRRGRRPSGGPTTNEGMPMTTTATMPMTATVAMQDASDTPADQWEVLRGPIGGAAVTAAVTALAERHRLRYEHADADTLRLTDPATSDALVTVRLRGLPPQEPRTLGFQVPPPAAVDVLIDPGPGRGASRFAAELRDTLAARALPYTDSELAGIRDAMPLLERYSSPQPAFDDWALLFRDHYLEHSTGFVLAMERAGIPAEWIFALDKGDQTWNRDRVHATFLARGYRSDILDNTAVNDPDAHQAELARVGADIDAFLDSAHAAGRRVLVVDDGGLLARGYGTVTAPHTADAALELTVSGIKRIAAAGELAIPVLNLARSQVKSRLGYREIADSCLRRVRTLLPDRKIIGRRVLLLGHGTLGSLLATQLRDLGCRVDVVDTDLPALIDAAENGFTTYRTARQALSSSTPFLVVGTTGEVALTEADLSALPDGVLLAPFATRDFSVLTEGPRRAGATEIPGIGLRFDLPGGRTATLLGNGRSMNLFQADSIPTQGYDAYRAGTLIAAATLCADPDRVPAGLHTGPADAAIAGAGLWDAYYDLYCAEQG